MVRPELTRGNLALFIEDCALTLAQIISPLTVVDRVIRCCVIAATSRSLSIDPVTDIDIASVRVYHATLLVLNIRLPSALIDGAILVDHLANALLHEELVLSEVNFTPRVE